MMLRKVTSIEDLRALAERRVPRAFFQYADHGSYTQSTMRSNRTDLEAIKLRQRVGIDVASRDLSTTIVGEPVTLPLALAPIGLSGMHYGDGEILACRAAQAAGIPFCLSTMSICSVEDVAAAVEQPFWFQLYMIRDRGFVRELIDRVIAAKCSVLVLTLDLNMLGQRHADIKNGMTVPPEITLANVLDVATKPRWLLSILKGKRKTFGNLAGYVKGMEDVNTLAGWISKQFDPSLNWKDIEWVRGLWPGKFILKGSLGDRRFESWRSPTRRRSIVDLHAPEGRRCRRLGDRGAFRRRGPQRSRRLARPRARRPRLPDRTRFRLRFGGRGSGGGGQSDRDHPQRARRLDGVDGVDLGAGRRARRDRRFVLRRSLSLASGRFYARLPCA